MMHQVRKMTDEELDRHIENPASSLHAAALFRRAEQNHDTLVEGQKNVRDEVAKLSKPHWVLWATLFVGAVAATAGVIMIFR